MTGVFLRPTQPVNWALAGLGLGIASRAGKWASEGPVSGWSASARRALCRHRLDQRADTDDVHDPGQIVGKHAQRHLGSDVLQPLHQEMGRAHPGLDGAKGMLDRLAALTHGLGVLIEPPLDGLKDVFVLPASDPALLARGAAILDGAMLAGVGPVAAQ